MALKRRNKSYMSNQKMGTELRNVQDKIEEFLRAGRLATDLITSDFYAVKLMVAKGCIVLRKTVA